MCGIKRALAVVCAVAVLWTILLAVPANAASYNAVLVDLDGSVSDSREAELLEYMQRSADNIGCNIGVVITDDLNGEYYKDYANDFGDSVFGVGSSFVVLLLLNSNGNPQYSSYTDYISTSGRARDYYDSKIDRIFDSIYEGLDTSGFEGAVLGYCDALDRYAGSTHGISVHINLGAFFAASVFGLIIALAVVGGFSRQYSKKSPVSATNYLDKNRTVLTRKADVFVREYTHSYSNSSSSHSGGSHRHGGGGGHHRSGGHGGGGGRHR